MTDGPTILVCSGCGEKNSADAFTCQTCGAALPLFDGAAAPRSAKSNSAQFGLSTLLSVVTLICVVLALFASAPGLAIFAAIFAFPAFIRTAMVARRRAEIGRPMSADTRFTAFLGSMMTAITIAVVVVVASVGTFCTICLTAADEDAIPVAVLIALIVTIPVLIGLGKWVRNRYRRDTLTDHRRPAGSNE